MEGGLGGTHRSRSFAYCPWHSHVHAHKLAQLLRAPGVSGVMMSGLPRALTCLAGIWVAAIVAFPAVASAGLVDSRWGDRGFVQEVPGEALWAPVKLVPQSGGRVDALVTTPFLGGARWMLRSGPNGQSPSLVGGPRPGGARVGQPGGAVRLPDGRLVTTATRGEESQLPTGTGFGIAAVRPDSRPDTSFGEKGLATVPKLDAHGQVTSVTYLGSGRLLAAGRTGGERMVVARFTAAGAPDASFGSGGYTIIATPRRSTTGPVFVVALGAGRFAVAGTVLRDGTMAARVAVAYFGADGRQRGRATLLRMAPRATPSAVCGAAASRGRLVLVGALSADPGGDGCPQDTGGRLRVVRLSSSGRLDRSFNRTGYQSVPFGAAFASADGVTPESSSNQVPVYARADGRIVIGGALAGNAAIAVARLLPDGRLDQSLGGSGRACTQVPRAYDQSMDAGAYTLAPGPAGRIYAATAATVTGADDSVITLVRLRAASRSLLPCASVEAIGSEATVGGVLTRPATISVRVDGMGTVKLGARPAGPFALPWNLRVRRRALMGTFRFIVLARAGGSREAAAWPAQTITVPRTP